MADEPKELTFTLDDTVNGQPRWCARGELPSTVVDEQALQTLWQRGRVAWRDVESASAWVEELRGNTQP